MEENVGFLDRILRSLVGVLLLSLAYYYGNNWLLYIIGGIILLTGIIGYCPVYEVLGINTVEEKKKPSIQPGQKTKAKKAAVAMKKKKKVTKKVKGKKKGKAKKKSKKKR